MVHSPPRAAPWAVLALFLIGCGGPDPSAFRNRTFYEYGGMSTGVDMNLIERDYPPLHDWEPKYRGVAVLTGIVRFSRPRSWVIRRASIEPQERYIEYVSPSQVLFSIYERLESPWDPWRVLLSRYEKDLKEEGGQLLSKPFPFASFNAQGREYVVERGVPAPKMPFVNRSREILLRSDHRIVLVQIVHQGRSPATVSREVLPALTSMQVL